jgi:ribosomal protein L2
MNTVDHPMGGGEGKSPAAVIRARLGCSDEGSQNPEEQENR